MKTIMGKVLMHEQWTASAEGRFFDIEARTHRKDAEAAEKGAGCNARRGAEWHAVAARTGKPVRLTAAASRRTP